MKWQSLRKESGRDILPEKRTTCLKKKNVAPNVTGASAKGARGSNANTALVLKGRPPDGLESQRLACEQSNEMMKTNLVPPPSRLVSSGFGNPILALHYAPRLVVHFQS